MQMVEERYYMDDKLYDAARLPDTAFQHFLTNDLYRIRTIGDESNVIHVAAQYGNQNFIKEALDKLPNHIFHLLCKQNSKGETPLHLAAELGKVEIVEALLTAHDKNEVPFDKKKPCWSELDRLGDTPVHRALKYGHEDIAISLLEKDIQLVSVCNNASESLAYLAADSFCEAFMQKIFDVYDQSAVSFSGPFDKTVFHPARKLNEKIMSTLIEKRRDLLKAQERNTKKTVLHYAVEEKRESIVKILIKADSSLAYLHDKDGMTPLHRAANMGLFSMIRTILELSPQSLAIRDESNGQTALHIAKLDASSLERCLKTTRMKELVNVADKNGNTPLHLALTNSDIATANKLLEVDGINWRLTNEQGYSPMELCTSDDKIPFKLKSLASPVRDMATNFRIFPNGVNVDGYNWEEYYTYEGDTIFHIAARDGYMKIINQASPASLLSKQNFKGETPLHLAAQHGQLEVVSYILKKCTLTARPENGDNHSTTVSIRTGDDVVTGNQLADIKPLRIECNNGETPIHKALINQHETIALSLLSLDRELLASSNSANISVLYLAAKYRCNEFLGHILSGGYNSLCKSGPNGQNVIHAAARSGGKTFDLFMNLIKGELDLIKKVDDYGKTPLHHAAEEGYAATARKLLKEDITAAFKYDNEGFTPLLRAAVVGYVPSVEKILSLCPHSAELRDPINNRTVLHLVEAPCFFLKRCMKHQVMLKLINETDKDGNTALHCAIMDGKIDKALVLLRTKGINWKILNKQQQSPMDLCNELKRSGKTEQRPIHGVLDILNKGEMGRRPEREFMLSRFIAHKDKVLLAEVDVKILLNKIAVAAALLVSMTFAASFTIPAGGYNQNTGEAMKGKYVAFQVFIASDVLAMLMAIGILFKYTTEVRPDKLYWLAITSIIMLQISLGFTVVAFISSLYARVSNALFTILIPFVVAALIYCVSLFRVEVTGFKF